MFRNKSKNRICFVETLPLLLGCVLSLTLITLAIVIDVNYEAKIVRIISQILLVIGTIIGSGAIGSAFITSDDYNSVIDGLVHYGLANSKSGLRSMSSEWRVNVMNLLMEVEYCEDSKVKPYIYKEVLRKLHIDSNIYYEKCDIKVRCKIENDKVVKEITKTLFLSSFSKPVVENDFVFSSKRFNSRIGNKTDILELTVDNKKVTPKTKPSNCEDILETKNGYDMCEDYFIEGEFKIPAYISGQQGKKITFVSKTETSIKDLTYIWRVIYPCKECHILFELDGKNKDNYKLQAHLFGFISKGEDLGSNEWCINKRFEDWIFKSNGIAIYIEKK